MTLHAVDMGTKLIDSPFRGNITTCSVTCIMRTFHELLFELCEICLFTNFPRPSPLEFLLSGDHFGVSVRKCGDHFGVGIISGSIWGSFQG